jgi:hypothetical protein
MTAVGETDKKEAGETSENRRRLGESAVKAL